MLALATAPLIAADVVPPEMAPKPEPTAAPASEPPVDPGKPSTTSEAWFLSKTGGFRIRFPRGWFFGPGPSPADCSAWAPNDIYENSAFTQFSVVSMARTGTMALAADDATEMVRLTQKSLEARLINYHWLDSGALKPGEGLPVSGKSSRLGKYLVYTFTEGNQNLAGVIFFLIEDKRQFICHGRCLAERLDNARPTFTQMAQSIELTGAAATPWELKDGRYVNTELNGSLALPAGYTPTLAGGVTVFRHASDDKGKPAPQISVSSEPLPAPLQWVVYLEGVKRGLRERLVDFRPLSDTTFNLDAPATSVETHLFEYAQTVGTETVRVFGLYCFSDHMMVVVTGSAPETDYAAARDEIFLPTAKSLQWPMPAPGLPVPTPAQ